MFSSTKMIPKRHLETKLSSSSLMESRICPWRPIRKYEPLSPTDRRQFYPTLSQALLEAIILPVALKPPPQLLQRISRKMDEHLHIQSDWVSVLQALVFITIENDYEYSQKDVETVLRKRGSFMNLMEPQW